MYYWLVLATVLLFAFVLRVYLILPKSQIRRSRKRTNGETCKLAAFLGSGGHTNECIALLSELDFNRYSPRVYVVSEGDFLSAQKAEELEKAKAEKHGIEGKYSILTIPRARRVHQPLLAAFPDALHSLSVAFYHFTYFPLMRSTAFSDVLILNGPGTCFIICVAALCSRLLGIPSPVLIYVESFARVKTLSLSGKLLRPLVDHFLVQWPQALANGSRGECRGWLV